MSGNLKKVTKEDLIQAAGLHQSYRIYFRDGTERTGKLIGLTCKGLTLQSENGSAIELSWHDVYLAEQLSRVLPDVPDAEIQAWRKQQQRDLNAGDVFSLLTLCRPLFDGLLAYECPPLLKDILSIRRKSHLKNYFFMNRKEMEHCLEQMESLLRLSEQPEEQGVSARAFLFLLGKDFAAALRELLPHVLAGERDYFLPTICLYSDMGDSAAAFFWTMRYFDQLLHTMGKAEDASHLSWIQEYFENSPYWWAYLRQVVGFDYFQQALEHIERLYGSAPNLAIRSLAYLFSLKSDKHMSDLLYRESCASGQPLSLETMRTFYTSLSYHVSMKDWNSFFYRYYLRANDLIDRGLYRSYEDGMEMEGCIYEYVNQRECYCRVLGLDLISYFFHLDNDPSVNEIRKQCRKEMGSLQTVRQELPIRVRFRSDRELSAIRKSYQVSGAILD